MARVVVGLSGGVDSSVAAYLLKEAGHEVIGLFMRNWLDDSVTIADECPWLEDSNDAMQVAEKLGIPFQILDLSADYKERIVDYMFDEYANGRTPNPDVLCNREIKFDIFLKEAEKLGADFVATGHYCQKDEILIDGQTTYRLISGADGNKDQSYFLCQIDQHQLSKALFPIGHLQKPEVRRIAAEQELVTAEKRDSQGLCFIGKVKLPVFLQQQLAAKKGDIVLIGAEEIHPYAETAAELSTEASAQVMDSPSVATLRLMSRAHELTPEMGRVIGQHEGAHFFTVGQRKGLGVGGFGSPLFIIGTDVESNTVYVGEGDTHPGLYREAIHINAEEVHWLRKDHQIAIGSSRQYDVRIRYRQPLEKAMIHATEDGLYIDFDPAQRGVAAGQFAAWYAGEELIGSGVIGE